MHLYLVLSLGRFLLESQFTVAYSDGLRWHSITSNSISASVRLTTNQIKRMNKNTAKQNNLG